MSKSVRLLAAALLFALLPSVARAQGTISGTVTDQSNQQPLQDAQVQVIGTQRGAATDRNGHYTITGVPAGTYQVRARRIGYAFGTMPATVGTGATATVNFALSAAATQLEQVVVNAVTGVAERKVEVGTNVGHVSVAELNKGPITSLSDVLQGRVAGVNLQSVVGTAGGGQRIRIRGANSLSLSNEPLIYIDGIAASNSKGGITLGGQDYSRINDINPEEIENIEVLKGPAASAIYGSAASNGVILITTKRGRAGRAEWRTYAEAGQIKDVNKYPLNYAALQRFGTGDEFYVIEDGGLLNIKNWYGSSAPFGICTNYNAAAGLCTQDVTLSFDQFRNPRTTPYQTGSNTKFGLNVAGGAEALTYFLSADQQREYGVLRPNDLNRISLRSNINAKLGNHANTAITVAYIRSDTKRMSNDNSVFSPLINALLGPAQYLEGMESDTVRTASDRLGSWFGYNTADQRKVNASQDLDRFVIGGNANYTPLSWLRINGNAGLDYFGRYDRQTMNPNVLPLAQVYILGFRDSFRSSNYIWTTNASAAGTFSPTSSIVSTTTVGTGYQRSLFEQTECFGAGIPGGTASCSATTSQFAVAETHTDLKTIGIFGREELSFADRFFLSGSIRADNNSGLVRSVSGLSWYPSVNGSWVVSRESFFPAQSFVSQFRLRAGWGQAGQRPGFGQGDTFFGSRVVQSSGVELPALVLTSTGNPNLKVERTTELEGGFDLGLFSDRINADFTVFRRRSKDALVARDLAPSAGLTGSVFQNLGSVKNWGTELGLNANILTTRRVSLDAHMTATTLKNRIEDLGPGIAPITTNRGYQAHRQGFPTGAFYAIPIKWSDADGNGKIGLSEVSVDSTKRLIVPNTKIAGKLDTLNLAYVGPSLPTNTQTLSGDLTLFNALTFSALFERRAGNRQQNETERFRCLQEDANPLFAQCGALSDPSASLQSQAAYIAVKKFNSAYLYQEDASFIKWREFSVKASVPEALGSRVSALKGASITLAGRNLKKWTDYTGLDPEINESGGSNFNQGEFNTQPPVRIWTLRFDFKL